MYSVPSSTDSEEGSFTVLNTRLENIILINEEPNLKKLLIMKINHFFRNRILNLIFLLILHNEDIFRKKLPSLP